MSHTIAAISTGIQISAIGIIRMSGSDCIQIADQVFSSKIGLLENAENRKMMLGTASDSDGRVIDHCMAVVSRAPHSYTGENTVEFHCHGSPAVLTGILDSLYDAGARPAQRGEFTKRAFLNGKMDLTQAEAVIDLIEADTTDAAANAASQVGGSLYRIFKPVYNSLQDLCSHFHAVLDYPDEDIDDFGLDNYLDLIKVNAKTLYDSLQTYGQGRILRQGAATAIIGRPNVGKSSLLNALSGYDRAIVSDIPGTTRDTIEESVMLGSIRLRLIDTAGIRRTDDTIEALGIERSQKAADDADLILFICDGSTPLTPEDQDIINMCVDHQNTVALINKIDKGQVVTPSDLPFSNIIEISLKESIGLDLLSDCINTIFEASHPYDGSILTNSRQYNSCRRAYEHLLSAVQGIHLGFTPDAILIDIEASMEALGEVTGASVREDITARIFERFCVGK